MSWKIAALGKIIHFRNGKFFNVHHDCLLVGIVFAFTFAIGLVCVTQMEKSRNEVKRTVISDTISDTGKELENAFDHSLTITYFVAALLQQGNGEVRNFSEVARYLLNSYPHVSSLQLAPDGIVEQVVPLAGNEAVIGHDLFNDPRRATEAVKTRENKKLTLAGPFPLLQGGSGSIGRLPVFLSENGKENFWGFVNVVISFPAVFENTGLSALEDKGVAYRLWRYHPDNGEMQVILSSSAPLKENPCEKVIRISGVTWYLSATPVNGWLSINWVLLDTLVAFLVSSMAAFLMKLYLDLKRRERKWNELALADELTQLPNRRCLHLHLEQMQSKGLANGRCVIGYVDIDDFKQINDRYGHDVGDAVIKKVAEVILACLREGDLVARVGGDEFVLIIQETTSIEACRTIFQRIILKLSNPLTCGIDRSISLSMGAVDGVYDDIDTLLQQADLAMYQAKESGKGKYCFYSTPQR